MPEEIPEPTLQMLAKSFFARSREYGFGFQDYVRFVNLLLDLAMRDAPPPKPVSAAHLPLADPQVSVRAFEAEDRTLFHAWLSDPRGRYFLLSRSTGRTEDIDALLDHPSNEIGVITTPEGLAVGAVAFLQIEPGQGRAELRKLVSSEHRGRGFGKAATRLWVAYGRSALGLHKIYLYTVASHLRNIRLNEELGFRVEGLLRREVRIDGEYHDILRMGLV